MNRRERLRRLTRGGGLVLLGNVAAAALGLLLLLVLGRALSPAELAVVVGVIAIVDGGQMFLTATVNTGMINLASRDGTKGLPSPELLRAGFWSNLGLGLVFAVVVAAAANTLSVAMLGDRSIAPLLAIAGVAAAAAGMTAFVLAVVTAQERFAHVASLTVLKNLFRIAVVVALLWAGSSDPKVLAFAICGAAGATALLAAATLSWSFLRVREPLRAGVSALLSVNGWLALSALGMLGGRLDVWLVGWLGSAEQAGLYAVAAQLCVGVGIVTQALVTTLLPTVSRFSSAAELTGFLRGAMRAMLPLALLPIFAWLLAGPVLGALFGPEYVRAAPIFVVLFVASIMTLAGAPLMLSLLSVGEARMLAFGALLQFALRVSLALIVVPMAGGLGLAGADVLSRLVAMGLIAAFIWRVLEARLDEATASDPAAVKEVT